MLELLLIISLGLCFLVLILSCFSLYFILNLITENKMNQQRINDLTAQLNAGNANIIQTIQSESAEVQAAIADNTIDTTELEAAIAQQAELANLVEGIYNAPTDTPEEVPTEETSYEVPTDEIPNEAPEDLDFEAEQSQETQTDETASDSEVVTNDVAVTESETETATNQTTDEVS